MTIIPLTESKLFINTLRVAGPAFFVGMQASSVKTALTIVADKSVRSLSPLPFISLLTNCIIWTFYGVLIRDNTVIVPNAAGILSGAFCVSSYHKYAAKSSKEMYFIAAGIVALATGCAMLGNSQLLGSIGCALSVLLMASPLATLKTVITEKSTASLPFGISFCGTK
jgi:solute carrier family 50 protein (sugar transporter)